MNTKSPLRSYFGLIALIFSLAILPQIAQAAPANDNFANAVTISGASGSISGSNVDATSETGEPVSISNDSGKSVWYRWTAPTTGGYVFQGAAGFNEYTYVGTGTAVNSLTNQSLFFVGSRIIIYATAGKVYSIRISGASSDAPGNFVLSWMPSPANDNFANATVISGNTGSAPGSTLNATYEPGETYPNRTVWYRWTAPSSGGVRFVAQGNNYASMHATTGSAVNSLTSVPNESQGYTDPDNSLYSLTFYAAAGTTYNIQLSNMETDAHPDFVMTWSRGPANDNFSDAIPISGASGSIAGTTVGASTEPGEPANDGNSVWYRWTAPATGGYTFLAAGAQVFLATGATVSSVTPSSAEFDAVQGTTYNIMVNNGPKNGFVLTWVGDPPNDDFVNAIPITGKSGSVTASNIGADREPGEPGQDHDPNTIQRSVWYRWTAPADGYYTFTPTAAFATAISITTGASVSGLTAVTQFGTTTATSYDPYYDQIVYKAYSETFHATAGATYNISLGSQTGYNVGEGSIVLHWAPAPANDFFADATVISGDSGSIAGTNIDSSVEPNEYLPRFYYSFPEAFGASVWYRWTAPADGGYTFSTTGNFNNIITVSTGTDSAHQSPQSQYASFIGTPNYTVTIAAVKGVVYNIQVDDFHLAKGNFVLKWARGPVNDVFSAATVLTGRSVDINGSNVGATTETNEPAPAGSNAKRSVWYQWTAPATGPAAFTAASVTFNPLLAVYTGATVNALTAMPGTSTGLGTKNNTFSFNAVQGTTYRLLVDDYASATGAFNLYGGVAPANDDFANAQLIGAGNGHVRGINLPATAQTGEPQHAGVAGGTSVWFKWTAPTIAANVTFNTAGSEINTLLAVYTGPDVAHLTEVASNDDLTGNVIGASRLAFHPTAGVTYYIAVDGKAGVTGHVTLNWTSAGLATSHLLWTAPNGAISLWRQTADGAATKSVYASTGGAIPAAISDGPDGLTRILWIKQNWGVSLWNQDSVSGAYTKNDITLPVGYQAFAVAAGPDNATHVLWNVSDGSVSLLSVNPIDGNYTQFNYGPYAGWTPLGIAAGPDSRTRIFWRDASSVLHILSQESATGTVTQSDYTAPAGWAPKSVSIDPSNQTHVLWSHTDGRTMLWTINPTTNAYTQFVYPAYTGWTASSLGMGSDGLPRVLLNNPNGQAWTWSQNSTTGALTQFLYGPYSPWTATGVAN